MILLESSLLLPMDSSPIENGGILVEDNIIHDVGFARDLEKLYSKKITQITCLNDTVLMPGFVNAHSHLELTCMRGFPYPGTFTGWIEKLVQEKNKISAVDYEKGILQGIDEMLKSGITTIGDHVSFNTDLITLLKSPFRGYLFVEALGTRKEMAEETFGFAKEFQKMFKKHKTLLKVIPTPHSVHALHPEVFKDVMDENLPAYSIHLAESADEDKYFKQQQGPLYDFIKNKGEIPDQEITQCNSAIHYLEEKNFLSDRVTAIHCNYVDEEDIRRLAEKKISVVHCPGSHAYFHHRKFVFDAFRAQKVNIALGTDSLASGESLSMLDQIRIGQKECPAIPPPKWLRMATLHGAHALKLSDEIGSLSPGKKADVIGFELSSELLKSQDAVMEEILKVKQVDFMMIDGKVLKS